MKHFAGLDVSVKETSICIVDETGRIVREARVASEPQATQAGPADYPIFRVAIRAKADVTHKTLPFDDVLECLLDLREDL